MIVMNLVPFNGIRFQIYILINKDTNGRWE